MPDATYHLLDNDNLLRRVIFTNPSYVRPDQTLTSFAFTPRKIAGVSEDLSVDVERLTTYETSIVDRFNYRLYAVNVRSVKQLGLSCEHDPLPKNFAHALIKGEISKSKARELAAMAIRIKYPD